MQVLNSENREAVYVGNLIDQTSALYFEISPKIHFLGYGP